MKDILFKRPNRLFVIPIVVIFVDQLIKLLVKFNMVRGDAGGAIHVIGDFFKIHFTENKGAAFGMTLKNFFPEMGDVTAKVALTVFSIIAVGAIVYFLVKSAKAKSLLPEMVALILGGAIGNIIDRMFYGLWFASINDYDGEFLFGGRVVDMFFFDFGAMEIPFSDGSYIEMFPIFNIADISISVGIIVIILFQKRFFQIEEEALKAEEEAKTETTEEKATAAVDKTSGEKEEGEGKEEEAREKALKEVIKEEVGEVIETKAEEKPATETEIEADKTEKE